jgi:hypothetical protein
MAIINSYPTIAPAAEDLVLIVDTSVEGNPTRTATLGSLSSATGCVIGSGTANTVPIFTTDGTTIGDSDIVKNIDGFYTSYDVGTGSLNRSRLKVYANDLNAYSSLDGHVLQFSRPTISYINPVANLTQSLRIGAQSGNTAVWSGVDVCADNFFRVYDPSAVQILYVNTADRQVNIGSSYPPFNSKLNVEGDTEIIGSANGVILESPDGTRYRITVQNGGTLSVSAV